MPGVLIFTSLRAALDAGFCVYDSTRDGYLVRKKTSAGWALAFVELRPHAPLPVHPDLTELEVNGIRNFGPVQEWR